MEGQAKVETFDYIGDDPATAPLLKEMRGPDGKPRVCDRVWISYLTGSPDRGTLGEGFGKLTAGYGSRSDPKEDGGKIGPEFTFGLDHGKGVRRPDPDHQDRLGRQVAEHGLPPAQRRTVRVQRDTVGGS